MKKRKINLPACTVMKKKRKKISEIDDYMKSPKGQNVAEKERYHCVGQSVIAEVKFLLQI